MAAFYCGSAMDRLQEIYDVYHQNDESFTMADALEEFTAEATAGLFSTEDGAQDFVRWLQNESGYTEGQKKTVLQKAAELFEKIINRIKALLQDGVLSSTAMDFAQAQADEAARLRQVFLKALDGMEVAEGAMEQSGEKFSLAKTMGKSWDEQMKMLYDEKTIVHSDTLTFGKVPSFLVDAGIENKQLAVPLGVLSNGQSGRDANHSIRRKEVRALGKKIMNPSIVIDNEDRNSLVFVLNPEKGDIPILIAFRKNMVFDRDDVHAARSFHFQPSIEAMISKLSDQSRVFINKNNELKAMPGTPLQLGRLNTNAKLIDVNITQAGENVNTESGKNSLRMAETPSVASGDSSPRGGAKAGGLERVEYTDGPNGEVLKNGRVQVARIVTFGAQNNREIVRRLQAQSDFFKGLTTADALSQFRYAEQNGLVERGDDWLAVYHDANDAETIGEAEQMDKLRLSLGIEAQNRSLLQQNEAYRKIVRQQDVEIRELQRTLTQAGVKIMQTAERSAGLPVNCCRTTAHKVLKDWNAERSRMHWKDFTTVWPMRAAPGTPHRHRPARLPK